MNNFRWLFYKLKTPITALSISKEPGGKIVQIEYFKTSSFACVLGEPDLQPGEKDAFFPSGRSRIRVPFQGKLLAVFPFEDNMEKKMLGK
jgi:hypothetical protein